jgi:phosphatidate cytidylyltransferase
VNGAGGQEGGPKGLTGAGPMRMGDLRTRVATGLVMAVVAGAPVWIGGWAAGAFIAAVAGVMGWEYRRLTAASAPGWDAPAYGATLAVAALLAWAPVWPAELLALLAASAFGFLDLRAGRAPGWAAVGAFTVGLAAIAFSALRAEPLHGLNLALWVAVIVAATDIGAYFAGRLIGGPKLWPAVSPKKTWAGLGGGVALASAAALAFSAATTGTFAEEVIPISALAAIVAQGGDLAESALKRRFGAKDSSALLPGHGGALDRLDGFCAVALVAAAVTYLRGVPVYVW